MTWVAVAVVGGSLVSGYMGSQAAQQGAAMQAGAAGQAAQLQYQAQMEALAQQKAMWEQMQGNLQPYMQAGQGAISQLGDLMGTSGRVGAAGYGSLGQMPTREQVMSQMAPNFEFLQQQGLQSLQASAAARGMLGTGQGIKDITQYSQNLSENAYQQAYANYVTNQTNQYNRLSGLVSSGQNAAAGVGQAGMQTGTNISNILMGGAQNIGNLMTGAAAAGAAGQMGAANAWSGALQGGMNNYLMLQYMKKMTPPAATGGATGGYGVA